MANSRRWTDLQKEVARLRKHFLPARFDPLGQYSNSAKVQACTRAFLVLSHAEIESYLEEWAKDIARASEGSWNSSSKPNKPLAFLIATLGDRIGVPENLRNNAADFPQRLSAIIVKLFQQYYKQINDNHGIKESNVLRLFGPLGIPAAAMGTTLLPDLDSFGGLRGTHAHHSVKAVRAVLDPETEFDRVNNLVNSLVVLDQWLVSYKRGIR